ncbi:uncharacterized protein LOC122382800 isoform X3 [Amphibalanus amphitrite]|uniref:uncharacterized protein LOC122382800 isoform X3 n=1 Tax=Amphibalanus amphitrite TaxID=1232801 RepID=UPI001C926018|nr:uncharacterized protein LOC122382800 isoform X3 [Amphibalanus amphitrite]
MAHGKLTAFEPAEETFENYLQRFQFYCSANDVRAESKQKALFLTVVGQAVFGKIKDLISPVTLEEATFELIKEKVKNHYQPQLVEIAERYKFFQRRQREEETVAEYLADLKKIASNAQFGDYLDTALRDQLVCGLYDSRCQKELLCMTSLTLEKAVQHARAFEAVSKEVGVFSASGVHEIQKDRLKGPGLSCFRCGRVGHDADACWHVKTVCNKCHRRGHLAVVCPKQSKNRENGNWQFAKRADRRTGFHRTAGERKSSSHAVEEVQETEGRRHPEQQPQSPSDSSGTEEFEVLHTHKVRREEVPRALFGGAWGGRRSTGAGGTGNRGAATVFQEPTCSVRSAGQGEQGTGTPDQRR